MGRPPKRRRETDGNNTHTHSPYNTNGQASISNDSSNNALSAYQSINSGFDDRVIDLLHNPANESSIPQVDRIDTLDHNNSSSFEATQFSLNSEFTESLSIQPGNYASVGPTGMFQTSHGYPVDGSDSRVALSGTGCTCLANLYSTLALFRSLPPSSFPFSMGALSKATTVARGACHCEHCPTEYASALQNLMLLSTLLPLIAHEYGKLLAHVDERASKGGTITFRMGEKEQVFENLHRHTGNPDCPMAFELDLSAEEWRSMARKVITRNVLGPKDLSVSGVVDDLERRQKQWHEHPILAEFQHGTDCHGHGPEIGDEHICLKLLSRVKSSIEALKLQ